MAKYYYNKYNATLSLGSFGPERDSPSFGIDQPSANMPIGNLGTRVPTWNGSEYVRNTPLTEGGTYVDRVVYLSSVYAYTQYYVEVQITVVSGSKVGYKIVRGSGKYRERTTSYIRGSLVQSNIVAENGTYPANGRHSDGYWYVRQGLVNATPTITLSTTDNRTLYENDTISLTGNARDENNGDVVTVRYSINNGTSRAITTAISDTTDIPFNKTLTFKNGKLFDGAAEVTSDLAEGSQHTLKVWATDDKGGASEEQIRSFYVVPNRPANLTIKPFSPASDLIETDKITIQGNAVDPDGNNITVSYKIANGSYQEVYSGRGGDFDFLVNLSDLEIGKNTISVQVKDTYGATSTKTLEITKSKDVNELKTAVARYKLSPPNGSAKGIVLWIEREVGDLTIDVNIHMGMNGEAENFVPMTLNSTAYVSDDIEEDEFIFEADAEKENIILEITMNRSSTVTNKGITLISGVLS